jgi:hypothetical protein
MIKLKNDSMIWYVLTACVPISSRIWMEHKNKALDSS